MALRIAHSRIKTGAEEVEINVNKNDSPSSELDVMMAKKGFHKALIKNAEHIAEIQKYFPGWVPRFR